MMTGHAIGIDLGTTNCLVGVWRDGHVQIIENESGERSIPAYVAFTDNERLIGEMAKNMVVDEPENTVYDVKHLLGTRFVRKRNRELTFNVESEDGVVPNIVVQYRKQRMRFSPEEICALILEKLKQIAEKYLEESVTRAVISVPACFSDSQRQATIDSAKIAGLEVLGLVNEPTAAAFGYGMKKKNGVLGSKNVLLLDLGSGMVDVSMVHIDDGQFTVTSTVGNCNFGGNDFDNALVDRCLKNFKTQYGLDPSKDKQAMQRLRAECERAKIRLSNLKQTSISVDYLYSQQHFSMSITRAQFEALCEQHFTRIMALVDKLFEEIDIPKYMIDDIVLVGGCTRIPKIRQLLQDYFQVKEIKHSVNPDLAVVHGAAIQAAILNGPIDCPQWKLVDVCSHSFGIEFLDGRIVTAVKRHTKIPVTNEVSLVTSHDKQVKAILKIYEDEHVIAKNNNFLGEFKIVDIPPAPKGEETIRLTFEINPNGILNVSASLWSKLNSQKLVQKQFSLSNEQIEIRQSHDRHFHQSDQQYRDKIVQKNPRQTIVYKAKPKSNSTFAILADDHRQSIQTNRDQLENSQNRLDTCTEQEIVEQRVDLVQCYESSIDPNGILNVSASLSSTMNSQKLVRKQCCLTNEQIEEKRLLARRFHQADQQYRDKIVQKNLLETVLYDIKSKLKSIHIPADVRQSIQTKLDQLENCFIKEDSPQNRLETCTEQEIVEQRADLVRFYESIIDKYFKLK